MQFQFGDHFDATFYLKFLGCISTRKIPESFGLVGFTVCWTPWRGRTYFAWMQVKILFNLLVVNLNFLLNFTLYHLSHLSNFSIFVQFSIFEIVSRGILIKTFNLVGNFKNTPYLLKYSLKMTLLALLPLLRHFPAFQNSWYVLEQSTAETERSPLSSAQFLLVLIGRLNLRNKQ